MKKLFALLFTIGAGASWAQEHILKRSHGLFYVKRWIALPPRIEVQLPAHASGGRAHQAVIHFSRDRPGGAVQGIPTLLKSA